MFSLPEQLDKENMWYCANCKDHVQAFLQMEIYKAPKHLIIHMKKLKAAWGSQLILLFR